MLANGENKKPAAADGVHINLKVKSHIVDVPSYALGVIIHLILQPIYASVMACRTQNSSLGHFNGLGEKAYL
ncbi:hypothetical protein Tco_1462776 [Tanacetum coccineum]